jgi:hypothetical protein
MTIPRNTGSDLDGVAQTEADHFMKCPGCGQWFDMRDLRQVIEHVHDGEIEFLKVQRPSRARLPIRAAHFTPVTTVLTIPVETRASAIA